MADIVSNSKATHDYLILDRVEAGIVLHGTEVKSLRAGKGQIRESYVLIEKGQACLYQAHIDEYSHGTCQNHLPKAPRKLLLHKKEIRRLQEESQVMGRSLIPLSLYWKNGKVKLLLGVAEPKQQHDKRQQMREREADRDLRRVTMQRIKR